MNLGLLLCKILLTHPEQADMGKRRVACIGDSITFGAGVFKTRDVDSWTVLWQKQMGDAFQVLNYGVSGATLQKEGDFPYQKHGFMGRLKKASPEMIVLMLGTNDSKPYNWDKDRFAQEYEELVSELVAFSWPHRTVLMVPPKAFPENKLELVAFDINDSVIHDSIRPLIISFGEKYALPVIDLYELTESHPEYFDDGVHPNIPGNRAIADCIFKTLETVQ